MCCQCIKNHIIMHTKIFKKYKKVDFYGKITVFETLTLAAHISVFIFFNYTDAKNPFPTLPFNIYIYICTSYILQICRSCFSRDSLILLFIFRFGIFHCFFMLLFYIICLFCFSCIFHPIF